MLICKENFLITEINNQATQRSLPKRRHLSKFFNAVLKEAFKQSDFKKIGQNNRWGLLK